MTKNKQIIRSFIEPDLLENIYLPLQHRVLPDSSTTLEHIIAEGDKVFVMISGTATDNQTGKRVTMRAADLYRLENDKIVEHWDVVDGSEIA